MTKIIKFYPSGNNETGFFPSPVPASEMLPSWYRHMPIHMDGETETGLAKDSVSATNLTLKGCMPFLDSMTSGYMFTLPFDVEMRIDDSGAIGLRWATNLDLVSTHSPDQFPGLPSPQEAKDGLLKWRPGWRIETPTNYSCLFVHPLNRYDLPFRTISGVVDTDSYKLSVEFPFHVAKPSKKIIVLEKGTPICQVIPFRRDSWESTVESYNKAFEEEQIFTLKSKIVRSYQLQFWKKKSYR